MSRAINSAFDVLKMQHFEQQYGYEFVLDVISKAVQDPRVEKMRMFVLQNMDSPDPQMRRQAEEIYQQLTQVMSGAGGQISSATPLGVDPSAPPAPEGLMSTGNPKGEARPIMAKAFSAFLDAEFIRKNVIGTQETGPRNTPVQYSMPEPIESMSQRPLVPEMTTQTTPAPGMFGRFKQPVTTQVPTGNMVMGGPQTMNVQQNAENPMAGFGAGHEGATPAGLGGQMMPAPGSEVTRMPRPSPFEHPTSPPSRSFAGQGYTVDDAGNFVRPPNPYSGKFGLMTHAQNFETDLRKPVGEDRFAGNQRTNSAVAQMGAADQFTGV